MTNDILQDDTNKDFENSNKDTHNISSIAANLYRSDINALYEARYYHSYHDINIIPIPKPGEKIGETWDEEIQKLEDIKADGKSARGYGAWTQWQSKRQKADDVIELFNDKPNCNVAAITGKVSKIVAFDIDGEEAQDYFDKIIARINDEGIKNCIDNTMQTRTGSGCGKHVIVAIDPDEFGNDERINTTTLWKGNGNHSEIKLKAEGSYIVHRPLYLIMAVGINS